jgi:hypothetical protein
MGVEKVVIRSGNGTDYAKKHDEVAVEYTGKYNLLKAQDNPEQHLQDGSSTRTHRTSKARGKPYHMISLTVT